MANIEIQGIDNVRRAINSLPSEMRPVVLRGIATKPAQRAAAEARKMQPIGKTGATARTINILRVKNANQTFVEVGYKGRSLGHIYTSGDSITRQGRGTVKGFPNLFHKAGDVVKNTAKREMTVDITRAMVKGVKKYL